jgi:hypothetical protein
VRGTQQSVDPSQGWIWAQPRGRDPGGAWIWHGPRGGDPGGSWIHPRAVVWHSLRGGQPGGAEQWLCRPTRWGLGRPVVLLLYHGWSSLP